MHWRQCSSIAHIYPEKKGILTLKAPIATAADDSHEYFFIVLSEKIKHDISCESSAHQALFSSKNKSKKKIYKKSSAAPILLGSLIRINQLAPNGPKMMSVVSLYYVHGKHLRSCWDGQ